MALLQLVRLSFSRSLEHLVKFHYSRIWILFLGLLCICPAADGQITPSRVRGVLKDQKGAVVPNGAIEIRCPDAGVERSTTTDQEGRYEFDLKPAQSCRLSASAPGFEVSVRDGVRVIAEQDTVVDFVLKVGQTETVIVVTAPAMSKPLVVETDPRAPRQPIPAHDGADYLKSIPGFSIIRKGGTDGDPVLRGMAGSRLNILQDGQQILGGCGGRMDPPTAYVFPAAFEHITVLKGPESVLYGPGASAGTVLFERDRRRVEQAGILLNSSAIVGSFGRHDEMVDAHAAIPNAYVQAIATRSHADDYSDGNGVAVHSLYTRWSGNAALGWTPQDDTYLELSVAKSNGEAAYADRAMDGIGFARDNMGIRFDKRLASSLVRRVEAQAYYNYIDHVMDNFTLRTPGTTYSLNNPDRRTTGGRAAVTLAAGTRTMVDVGFDTQRNVHRMRSGTGTSAARATTTYLSAARLEDMHFNQAGIFGEATYLVTRGSRLIAGFRSDWHKAVDNRLTSTTSGATDRKTLKSGFGRYEMDFKRGAGTLYAGVGHAERFPDYWERMKQDPITLKSAFLSTRPEKTTQLDVGMLWRSYAWTGSVSGFYGKVNDYVLIRWSPAPTLTRNVDATTMGGEADVAYHFADNLRADATLAYVRANNDTDHKPLAQQPPLEATMGVTYDSRALSIGLLARLVGRQDRVDIGSGNIVSNGMDIGPTAGSAVFSVNGGYRLKKSLLISAGVDNLLDRAYAEHLSKSGAMVPGFVQTTRINEPGRSFWLKANFILD